MGRSATSTFSSTVKTFAKMGWTIIKYTFMPLLFIWKFLRMFLSLYMLIFLLLLGAGGFMAASGGLDIVSNFGQLIETITKSLVPVA